MRKKWIQFFPNKIFNLLLFVLFLFHGSSLLFAGEYDAISGTIGIEDDITMNVDNDIITLQNPRGEKLPTDMVPSRTKLNYDLNLLFHGPDSKGIERLKNLGFPYTLFRPDNPNQAMRVNIISCDPRGTQAPLIPSLTQSIANDTGRLVISSSTPPNRVTSLNNLYLFDPTAPNGMGRKVSPREGNLITKNALPILTGPFNVGGGKGGCGCKPIIIQCSGIDPNAIGLGAGAVGFGAGMIAGGINDVENSNPVIGSVGVGLGATVITAGVDVGIYGLTGSALGLSSAAGPIGLAVGSMVLCAAVMAPPGRAGPSMSNTLLNPSTITSGEDGYQPNGPWVNYPGGGGIELPNGGTWNKEFW